MTLLRSRVADAVGTGDRSSTRRTLLGLCLVVVAARTTYLFQPLRSDEGGYLLVARQWHSGGEFLYGDYHVDRPPLLMLVFRIAALTDWDPMIRVLAIPFVLVLVVSAWYAGQLLSGPVGARWAAVAAAGLVCSPAVSADQADGELFAAPLVMAGIALGLAAVRAADASRRVPLGVAAGALAGAAPLVKQNFLEGLVFLGVLVVATIRGGRSGRTRAGVGPAVAVGVLVPHVAVLSWSAVAGLDVSTMWQDLIGFRADALEVLWGNSPQASVERGVRLVVLAAAAGVLGAVVGWLVHARPWRLRGGPEEWAVTACLGFGFVSVVVGGSYWPHYLVEPVPALAVAVALVAPLASRPGTWMRLTVKVVVAAAVVGTVGMALFYRAVPGVWFQQRTGEWLAASSLSRDTAFVAYGNASILEAADMGSPYPYLWSLPMRTLDPDLARLRATLASPHAPAWIVQVNGLDSWGIDRGGLLRDQVEGRYRVVGEVCSHPVWLRSDLHRDLAPAPRC